MSSSNSNNSKQMIYKKKKSNIKDLHCKRLIHALKCDKNTFLNWIEFQFDNNMNWSNYGSYWQLDHIIPSTHFDMTNIIQYNKYYNHINIHPIEKNKPKNSYCDSLYLFFHIFKWLLFLKRYKLNNCDDSDSKKN